MDELLKFIQCEPNAALEFAKTQQGKLYLYGSGVRGDSYLDFCQKFHLPVHAILDSFHSGSRGGVPILLYENFLDTHPNPSECQFLISAPSVADEITEKLKMNFPQKNIASIDITLAQSFDVEQYRSYLIANWEKYCDLFSTLADDLSRKTLELVLKGRISGNQDYYRRCYVPELYYPPDLISFTPETVMVELGSNNGETLREFFKHCHKYCAVYSFEPEEKFLPVLKKIQAEQAALGNTLHIIRKGAWDTETTLLFAKSEDASGSFTGQSVTYKETVSIDVTTVDQEVKEPITYMKMDIEGSELHALQGAQEQIRRNHPTLAVSVYHKLEDILNIWCYLRELVPNYHFYLRHHTLTWDDTVLYAIK